MEDDKIRYGFITVSIGADEERKRIMEMFISSLPGYESHADFLNMAGRVIWNFRSKDQAEAAMQETKKRGWPAGDYIIKFRIEGSDEFSHGKVLDYWRVNRVREFE